MILPTSATVSCWHDDRIHPHFHCLVNYDMVAGAPALHPPFKPSDFSSSPRILLSHSLTSDARRIRMCPNSILPHTRMLINRWLRLRIGSYHLFPVGVLPDVFKVVEPRLEDFFVNLHTIRCESIALLHSDPCWLSSGIVGQCRMSCLVSLRAHPNIPKHSLMRPPNTASSHA
jgi:hypothetical protein